MRNINFYFPKNGIHLVLLALVVCLAGLVGCGRKTNEAVAEKAMENAIAKQTGGKADVDIKKDSIRIQTKEGEMTMSAGGNATVPSGFPKDVWVYPGATVKMALEVPEGYTLNLATKDAVAKVSEAYLKEMTARDWTKEMSMDMGGNSMLGFKKEGRALNLVISSEEKEGTHISLTVAKKKDGE
jgi:hypothetical protein